MNAMYKTVKKYYDMGFYNDSQVAVFVEKGKITETEYNEITGKIYRA